MKINPGDIVKEGEVLFTVLTKEAAAFLSRKMPDDTLLLFDGKLQIIAPNTGVVSTVAHQKGDYVQEGDELATLAEPGSLVFYLQAPYEWSQFIHKGQTCEISLSDGNHMEGVIGSVLPSMDVQAQTLTLTVIPQTSANILENLIAKVTILKYSKKKRALCPKKQCFLTKRRPTFGS